MEKGITLGTMQVEGKTKDVVINHQDRLHHMLLVGKAGVGKSSLMSSLILQDINAGRGLGLVDPYGDIISRTQSILPEKRRQDVIFIDAGDTHEAPFFNLLAVAHESEIRIVNMWFIAACKELIVSENQGEVDASIEFFLSQVLLSAIKTDLTVFDIGVLLTDLANGRWENLKTTLAKLKDPTLVSFWDRQIQDVQSSRVPPKQQVILEKIARVLSDKHIRLISKKPTSGPNPENLMDENKIILVRLARSTMPEDVNDFIASAFYTMFWIAALRRGNLEQASEFFLYIDEPHLMGAVAFADMLAEARRVKLALVIAKQEISDLPKYMSQAILGNIVTLVLFALSGPDADLLAPEVAPRFKTEHLTKLPRFQAIVKMMVEGKLVEPFVVDLTFGAS